MGQLKWYKRDPDAALTGFFELTLEERGAYGTVLDLIYARDGNLPDDDKFIAGFLRSDVRVWRRIKKVLLARGKITIEDGIIRNFRATSEILTALSRIGSASDAGVASGISRRRKSEAKFNKNNKVGGTDVPTEHERTLELTTTTTTTRKIEEEEKGGGGVGPAAPAVAPSARRKGGGIDFSDAANRQAYANGKIAEHLGASNGGWALVITANDPDDEGQEQAARTCAEVARKLKLSWKKPETRAVVKEST